MKKLLSLLVLGALAAIGHAVTVEKTAILNVYYPEYSKIDLVCGLMPKAIVKRLVETGQRNVLENVLETSATFATYFHVDARTIRRGMSTLQVKGIIRCDGPDKDGRWIIL